MSNPGHQSSVDNPQPCCSGQQGSTAPSQRTALSRSSGASTRVQKAALEAQAWRKRLEREQQLAARERERELELAARERERERELAALQQKVDDSLLQAELVALEVASSGSRTGSHRSSSKVCVERTEQWVKKQRTDVGCEQLNVASPGRPVPPPAPATTRVTALTDHTKISEAAGTEPRPVLTERDNFNTVLLQAVADTAAAAKAIASGIKKLELLPFSGNTLQWLQFKRTYDVTKTNLSPIENMHRLQTALRGPAREAVAALLMSTEDPEDVMRALEDNFARPELIVYQEVTSLRTLPRLGNELKELGTFSNRVRNSISTIKLLKQIEYLYSPELFHAVLGKLNPTMKIRWTDFAVQDDTGRPKLEILSDFLRCELDQHIRFGLSPESNSSQQSQYFSHDKQIRRENVNTTMHSKSVKVLKGKTQCQFCKKDHNIKSCSEFQSLSVDDRWQWLREAKVCYRCLKRNPHQWKTCKVNPCGVDGCRLRHNPLLHLSPAASVDVNTLDTYDTKGNICTVTDVQQIHNESKEQKVVVSTTSTEIQSTTVLAHRPKAYLKIIPVTVSGPAGERNVYALLDDGSTATLIDSSIAACIGASGPQQTITVNGIGGLEKITTVSYVDFYIKGRYTQETFLVKNARAMESLSLHTQSIRQETLESFSHLADLSEVLVYDSAIPTILIGVEHWHLTINREVRVGRKNEPVACLTALGWTLYGVASSKTNLIEFVNVGTFTEPSTDDSLEFLIKEQYKIDSLGICKKETLHSKQDQRAVDILEATSRRLLSGRFEVGMPWRDDIQRVPDSYSQAMSRFLSLEKRMAKDPDFAEAYKVFMTNMITKGYAELCSPDTYYNNHKNTSFDSDLRLYLPHFGVFHPQKRKIRVVHDAAATNEGVSLNSLLLPGPDLLQPLLKILFCFREGRVAVTADIKEMFPQVRIREKDRNAFRYLWRSDKTQPVKELRMTSVIFGACCSPFVAQFIKNKNALEHIRSYPNAVDAILSKHYMDDYIDSLDSTAEAAQLAADVITVHGAASFEMRGWISNDSAALNLVPDDLRATRPLDIELGNSSNNIRALGIAWNPTTDNLGFRTDFVETVPSPLTKRKLLSQLMRVYDPLGLLGPIVVRGRILFQQVWRLNVDWDTKLPSTEASKWSNWFLELSKVSSLKIPRWYAKASNSEPCCRELHVFADASELAYACVAYWRLLYFDGSIKLTLIASKARVSPLKPVSIPRLELQAALIASRFAATIRDSHRKKPVLTFFWTDSMTVLQWLRSDARSFKPFVAHRLGEILENSSITDWHWVPTDLNVADDATRMYPIVLDLNHRWFIGPSFLLKSPEDWPLEPVNVAPVREERKCRPNELVGLISIPTNLPTPLTANFSHFSDWTRLLRATARVHQAAAIFGNNLAFIRNSKTNCGVIHTRHPSTSTTFKPLNSDLIKAAERHIMQQTQLDSFSEEFQCIKDSKPIPRNSRLVKLSPIMGEDNLLRLAGRIKAVLDIDTEVRSPVLLDGHHPVVRLLVQHYHRQVGHANNETIINEMRQKYWLLGMRNTVRSVASKCLLCRIRKAKPMEPTTGDLPQQRLAHHRRPFTFTGLDYFGPINTTIGRRREKRYVALYTCMTSRAVHLELVHSLSADSAIMSIRRFIARRGIPDTLYSDNGTCFVGANRLLKEFYHSDVEDFAANKGIRWSFIPAAAPFFGGCWERLVRSVKVALYATLKEKAPKEEILVTLLLEAEAIVNSRLLSHVSVESDSQETLTPFHFLIGCSSNQVQPVSFDDRDLVRRVDWKKALRLADHFWNRWVKEVLPTMQPRQVNNTEQSLKNGDLVLVVDGTLPRGTWPRGRIAAVYPGKDGVVRVVDVATSGGLLRRPSKKLVKLVA